MANYPGQYRETGKGPYRSTVANWKAGVAVDGGDFAYMDTADLTAANAPYDKSAGSFTWTTDLLTTQRAFVQSFRGVSTVRRITAQTLNGSESTDGPIIASGEFCFPCAALAAALKYGDLVTIAKAAGNALDPKKVVPTTDPSIAVGKVTEPAAIGATRITFELVVPAFGGNLGTLAGIVPEYSAATGITAFAGGGQASATLLAAGVNRVVTVATAADSVKLPTAVAGMAVFVKNASANSLNVFPATGDAINALSANAAYALATVKSAFFVACVAGTWEAHLSA